ncbi:unnamed protein product [Polarella glacialis]|uniref:TIR domain-containing protein n=1 Tax=Polarella glacialis TaxID=89957 RepID=A0A813DLC7_POLGL|nr:unnamed protein product [Polarella glacialis]
MMILTARLPGVSFWLDVEQDPTEKGMRHGVKNSKDVLIYLTEGLIESKYCQMEMRWALEFKKNIILVIETDERHGKPSIEKLIALCPPDLKHIFADNVIIPWYRDPEFREISVEKIIKARSVKKSGPTVLAESTTQLKLFDRVMKFMPRSDIIDSAGGEVFDWTFVYFTVLCGVALPGARRKTKAWSVAVRIILLTCGCMCLSRIFTTEGPAFWDTGTIVQIVFAHPIIFLFLHVTLTILKSPLFADLLENRIDAPVEAKLLRFKTRIGTCVAALLTVSLSFWGWAAYFPAIFDMYYLDSASQQRPATLLLFGLAHGLTWVLILPLFFGSLFASLLMMFVLQMDLCNFQVSFLENWKIYKAQPEDPRVDRLRENWFLRVRFSWFLGSSLWFGAGAWIVALTPFGVSYYAWRLEMQAKQILFTHPGLRHSFLGFLAGFDLNFRVLFLHATVRLLPLYVCILIVNTVGVTIAQDINMTKDFDHYHGWSGFLCITAEDGLCKTGLGGEGVAANLAEVVAITAWVAVCSSLIFDPLRAVGWLRASDDVQDEGFDQLAYGNIPDTSKVISPLTVAIADGKKLQTSDLPLALVEHRMSSLAVAKLSKSGPGAEASPSVPLKEGAPGVGAEAGSARSSAEDLLAMAGDVAGIRQEMKGLRESFDAFRADFSRLAGAMELLAQNVAGAKSERQPS